MKSAEQWMSEHDDYSLIDCESLDTTAFYKVVLEIQLDVLRDVYRNRCGYYDHHAWEQYIQAKIEELDAKLHS